MMPLYGCGTAASSPDDADSTAAAIATANADNAAAATAAETNPPDSSLVARFILQNKIIDRKIRHPSQ